MKNKKKSIGGIDANIILLICYLGPLFFSWFSGTRFVAWLIPIIIYILERNNKFVKKHAAQASILYLGYSIISIVIMFMSVIMFDNPNVFILNLENFSGSLLMATMASMSSLFVLIVVTILTVIVSSKVWHYEDYDIPFIRLFINSFEKFMDMLMKNDSQNKREDVDDEIIVSSELEADKKEVIIEEDSDVIIESDIDNKKSVKKKNKKEDEK